MGLLLRDWLELHYTVTIFRHYTKFESESVIPSRQNPNVCLRKGTLGQSSKQNTRVLRQNIGYGDSKGPHGRHPMWATVSR